MLRHGIGTSAARPDAGRAHARHSVHAAGADAGPNAPFRALGDRVALQPRPGGGRPEPLPVLEPGAGAPRAALRDVRISVRVLVRGPTPGRRQGRSWHRAADGTCAPRTQRCTGFFLPVGPTLLQLVACSCRPLRAYARGCAQVRKGNQSTPEARLGLNLGRRCNGTMLFSASQRASPRRPVYRGVAGPLSQCPDTRSIIAHLPPHPRILSFRLVSSHNPA